MYAIALTYFMQTQVWPIAELQRIDRETRKITVGNGAKHPQGVTLPPQSSGERGLKSLETEYEITKMKAAVNIYGNTDPTIGLVRQFKEKPA